MDTELTIRRHFDKSDEKQYLETPFTVPENVESIDFTVIYQRKESVAVGAFYFCDDINVLDFSVKNSRDEHIGSAAAVRTHIIVNGTRSSDGFVSAPVKAGQWKIVTGTYMVAPQGVDVEYKIVFTYKERRVLKGDLHCHTTASDGRHAKGTLIACAQEEGLDFLCITDHHNYAENSYKQKYSGITVIPGMEWTNYCGHVGMLGLTEPYTGTFCTNTHEDTLELIKKAREAGAVIILNHPCASEADLRWALDSGCCDCIEVINGPMRAAQERTVDIWHDMLCRGERIAAAGGSDYHRQSPLRGIGVPCTCAVSMSNEAEDILTAVKNGNTYLSFSPSGPALELDCEGKTFGQAAREGATVRFAFSELHSRDTIYLITDKECEQIDCPEASGKATAVIERSYKNRRFVRVQVRRAWNGSGKPELALLSNPLYFDT